MKNPSNILWVLRGMAEAIDWDGVYESELPRIFNYFLYKVGDREMAQDLSATTFERAWRIRLRYHAQVASVPAWLFGIARNVYREHVRGRKREDEKLHAVSLDCKINAAPDMETSVQQQDDKERLRGLLSKLSEREQDLIALKYGARLTNREIARITGMSESNVGSILHRAVTELRGKWREDHG